MIEENKGDNSIFGQPNEAKARSRKVTEKTKAKVKKQSETVEFPEDPNWLSIHNDALFH